MEKERRLIDVNEELRKMQAVLDADPDKKNTIGHASFRAVMEGLKKAPTVDAVEVVRGNWNIRCEMHRDCHTGEVDEDFYLECSECHRKVWDVSQDDVLLGRYGKICNDYPYCHCGAKMDGERKADNA